MASNPPGDCCLQGFRHEGTATGTLKRIGDFEAYFAQPSASAKKAGKAIIILVDIHGHKLINTQLLADQFASLGYLTVIPDLFYNDPAKAGQPGFNIQDWLKVHSTASVDPIVAATIYELRSKHGIDRVAGVGYCFGGKYVARFLADGKGLDVGYTAHPSFVTPEELQGIKGPLSIAAPIVDQIFTPEKRRESEEILSKMDVAWQINVYGNVEHGFANRADIKIDKKRQAKEQAFKQAVDWFALYL